MFSSGISNENANHWPFFDFRNNCAMTTKQETLNNQQHLTVALLAMKHVRTTSAHFDNAAGNITTMYQLTRSKQ